VLGETAEAGSERNFREAIEKICATATAVSLRDSMAASTPKQNKSTWAFTADSRISLHARRFNGKSVVFGGYFDRRGAFQIEPPLL
jgi:hypothetical protein